MKLCETQWPDRPLDHLFAFRNLRGHKVSPLSYIVEYAYSIRVRARTSSYCAKGWVRGRDAQRGLGGGHRWKIEFRP